MPMRCPHCGSVVEPLRDTSGALFCPACQNTGQVAPAWARQGTQATVPVAPVAGASWQPPAPTLPPPSGSPSPYMPLGAPTQTSGKAIASLVVGISSIVLYFLGLLIGPVALGLGISARNDVRRTPGLGGGGMATAGIVLGIVGIVVGLVFAAFMVMVFSGVWLDGFDPEGEAAIDFAVDGSGQGGTLTVVSVAGSPDWSDYELGGDARCTLPSGSVQAGDEIVCVTDGDVVVIDWWTEETVFAATV